MKVVGIIPARMGSSRFPGKPMALIQGIPMIGHVYLRSKMSDLLEEVYVATCDNEIYDYIESIGGKAIMTSDEHERATDRTAEAMEIIEKKTKETIEIVVMIQGDEPLLSPEMINEAIEPVLSGEATVSNLMSNILSREEHEDPNEVKVVIDKSSFALYFSREPIPSWKKGALQVPMYKQVCIIPFTRESLLLFNDMPQTELEIIESVDMLRLLENGFKVKMIYTSKETYSVDTIEDLMKVDLIMNKDTLFEIYK